MEAAPDIAVMRSAPRRHWSKLAVSITAAVLCCCIACDSPETVRKFSASAVATLKTGDSLFDDMKASCIREARTRQDFGAFLVDDPNPPACIEIGAQAAGLKAVSELVSKYFRALNDLASFGTSNAGDSARDLLATASAQAKLSSASQNALAAIAGLLTRLATSAHQQRSLAGDIVKVHEDIKIALGGLGEAAGVAYVQQLQDEQKKTAIRYQEFLLQHPGAPEVILALDSRWQTDRASFEAKQKAAKTYQAALATLAKGNEELAAHARSLKTKDLDGLLSPYVAQLESFASEIQKMSPSETAR